MIRRLFNLVVALSLLLCVATVGLWVWSYYRITEVRRGSTGGTTALLISRGTVSVWHDARQRGDGWRVHRRGEVPNPHAYEGDELGPAAHAWFAYASSATYRVARAPLAGLVAAMLVVPALWLCARLVPEGTYRPWRRTFGNFTAGLSLVLCVAAATLWLRSCWFQSLTVQWTRDIPTAPNAETTYWYGIRWQHGWLQLFRDGRDDERGRDLFNALLRSLHPRGPKIKPVDGSTRVATYSYEASYPWQVEPSIARDGRKYGNDRHAGWAFVLPGWILPIVFAPLPAIVAARAYRRWRRRAPGHCSHCGYDLRATPDRCPECGASSQSKTDEH